MEMMNLVTSPFGVGEKVILELLKRGESVYTVFPSPKDVPMSFLGKINLKYGFIQFDRDVNLERALPKSVKNVFHLYEVYKGSFSKMFRSNTSASLLLFDWARAAGVSKFIYLSSGEVYGQGQHLNEDCAYNPRNFYATTKFEAEILLKYYYKSFEINTVRIFFPFGKNLDQGYIGSLFQLMKSGDTIDTEYRVISPTFIDDIVMPLVKIREIHSNEIFNICGGSIEVKTLIEKIEKLCNKSPKKTNVGRVELTGDSAKARKLLDYAEAPLDKALADSFAE